MDATPLTSFPCALCGGVDARTLFEKRRYAYVRCTNCGLVFVNPRHADATVANAPMRHAREEYREEAPRRVARRRKRYARRLRELTRFRSTGRFLEIGCREGHLLSVAAELGWSVTGVEPEEETASVARDRFGLDVRIGYLEDTAQPSEAYDVVYLCEVLEHVADPLPLLTEIRRVLRPGGAVWIKTGNVESLSARRLGADWSYFAYERLGHVSYFSPATLRALFERTGLATDSLRTWGIEGVGRLGRVTLGTWARVTAAGGHMQAIGRRP